MVLPCARYLIPRDELNDSFNSPKEHLNSGQCRCYLYSNSEYTPSMGDERMKVYAREKPARRGLNYFAFFLLFSSSSIIFTPLLENFPNLAPNGWEILIWLAWGYAIFSYSIILLIVNNVFRFLENRRSNLSPSPPSRNWLKNLKTLGMSLLLWFALLIILWSIPV